MVWISDYNKLQDTLASIYLDKSSALCIVEEAGIDPTVVKFSDIATDNWHQIIREADAQGKLISLVERAIAQYSKNETLKELLEVFKRLDLNKKSSETARSKIFISQVCVNNPELKNELLEYLESVGRKPILFENVNVCLELQNLNDLPDKSYYDATKDASLFVLVIGREYCSHVSSNLNNKFCIICNSITKKQCLAARDGRVPIHIYIDAEVQSNFHEWKNLSKKIKNKIRFVDIENQYIFQ